MKNEELRMKNLPCGGWMKVFASLDFFNEE